MERATPGTMRVACRNCLHYLVTWDIHLPHGCRAHGFKTARSPAQCVYEVSGLECLLFQPKNAEPGRLREAER
ncbi:MAG: uracil-DNA glycosylase [Acidobacteria bacterium]|nr:uracil-DNA glycosylase [Acidobacteriota bacterium]